MDTMMATNERRLIAFYWCVYMTASVGTLLVAVGSFRDAILQRDWAVGLVSTVVLAVFLWVVMWRLREFRSYQHIPGPKPSFLLGNLKDLLAQGHGHRDRALAVLHAEFGPVVRLHLAWGSPPYVSLSHVSKNLHRKDLDSYRQADRTVLPRSLMGLNAGEKHKVHRRAIMTMLTRRKVEERLDVIRGISRRCVENWKRGERNRSEGATDLLSDIHHWSANCLGAFLFDEDWDTSVSLEKYLLSLSAIEEEISFRTFHPFFVRWIFPRRLFRVRVAYRFLFAFLDAVMRQRESRLEGDQHRTSRSPDLLDKLAGAGAAGGRDKTLWGHKDCVEEMMSLVLGGTHAMSYTMSQALVLLSLNPEVQQRARESLDSETLECPTGGEDVQACDRSAAASVDRSPLKHIVYETLRLFPAVPFSSKFSSDRVLEQGIVIPRGTSIMWMKTVVGKNDAVFDEPHLFDPNRFSVDGKSADSVSSFLPFGAGPRHCVGSQLGEEQCVALLAEILRNFVVKPLKNVNVQFRATVSVAPSCVPVRLVSLSESNKTGRGAEDLEPSYAHRADLQNSVHTPLTSEYSTDQ
jgi:cytochrome P450